MEKHLLEILTTMCPFQLSGDEGFLYFYHGGGDFLIFSKLSNKKSKFEEFWPRCVLLKSD